MTRGGVSKYHRAGDMPNAGILAAFNKGSKMKIYKRRNIKGIN